MKGLGGVSEYFRQQVVSRDLVARFNLDDSRECWTRVAMTRCDLLQISGAGMASLSKRFQTVFIFDVVGKVHGQRLALLFLKCNSNAICVLG